MNVDNKDQIQDQTQKSDQGKNVNQNKDQNADHQPVQKQGDSLDPKDIRIKELEESWKRALADYKNLERRSNEEKDFN